MEDEECLPENSSLKSYLQNLGYSEVQVTKNAALDRNNIKFEITKPNTRSLKVESIDEGVIDQIGILISTQMLFEEDISNVEKVLSNFKVVKNGMMKSMFQGFFGVAVIFIGLCIYWIIGNYAFIIVSSFYAYRAAYYLQRKHFNQARLRKLTSILQTNFLLLKKAIKFIEENNKLISCHNANVKSKTEDSKEGFDCFNNFKSDFVFSMNEMISIFIKSTQKLIKTIPLYDYIETPEGYLCNNFNADAESTDFSKLYQVYLLLQSEFLQRLSLSLIPNIKLSGMNDNFQELNCILTEACVNLLKIKNKLNKKFKFIFLNGVHNPNAKTLFKVPPKTRDPGIDYKEEFVSNIHETSNTFQNLLIKSRILEANVTSDKIPANVEDELLNIQNDINSCQRNIADSFILLKKVNAVKDTPHVTELKEEMKEGELNQDRIIIGYSDLDPKVEDEIFEAYFADEKFNADLTNLDDWDFDDRLKKKLEKEYSKNVIQELKIKLVEKAKNWEKREAEILRKKGLINENVKSLKGGENDEESSKCVNNDGAKEVDNMPLNIIESNTGLERLKNITTNEDKFSEDSQQVCKRNFNNVVFGNLINEKNDDNVSTEMLNGFHGVNKSFLSDLGQARQRILNTAAAEEEFYCDSGEDSCEEVSLS